MKAKDKVEVLRQQVNALLNIERDMMKERQSQDAAEGEIAPVVDRAKPPRAETRHASISGKSHERSNGSEARRP